MSTERRTTDLLVVGAGIAGLATAWLIRNRARQSGQNIRLNLLEAAPITGGSTRTEIRDGYLCEVGPNGFLDNEPTTLELIEMLELRERLQPADETAANRYIYHGGAMRQVPMSPPAFLKSDLLPFTAKLRMAMELFISARRDFTDDETVRDFGRRRLGNTFATYLLDPMVSGIFAGDYTQLSLAATFPKMVEMEREHGGLFKAMFARRKEAKRAGGAAGGPGGPRGKLWTFRGGMGELTELLAGELQEEIVTSSPVKGLHHNGSGFLVESEREQWEASTVVLAAPSRAMAPVMEELAPQVAEALAGIPWAPVDVVCQGFQEKHIRRDLRGFGVLIPRIEKIRSLGTLWSDSIFPGQAPDGHRLMRTIIGGACDPTVTELTGEELAATVQRDLLQVMGIRQQPVMQHLYRHPQGIAQYNLGHLERVARTEELERELPGLFFCGASYRGVSVNGSIKDAFRVADSFAEQKGWQ